jgi:HAD superfamily hydrolase (TIGR01484 family)
MRVSTALDATSVVVTIATGRLFAGTRAAAEAIGLQGPVVCADGSHIVSASGRTLEHYGIAKSKTAIIGAALRTHGLSAFAFKKNRIIYDRYGAAFLPYVELWSNEIEHAEAVWDHEAFREGNVTALVTLGTETEVRDFVAFLSEGPTASLQSAAFAIKKLGGLWGCIVRAGEVNKGTGLTWLAEHHGIPLSETVCVGDWLNDVPMLRVAGRSFSMGQAPDEVKGAATHALTETAELGGGIARIVREVFGISV